MKLLPIAGCLAALLLTSAVGQTDAARELKQLQDQREKSLTAAAEPINRRYQAALEQLQRRATQTNDLDVAVTIKEELRLLAAAGMGAFPDTANPPSKAKSATESVSRLAGTSWLWGGANHMKFGFLPGGRFNGHFKGASWRPIAPDLIYYEWEGNRYRGVMRVSKDLDRIEAVEWQAGKPTIVTVPSASK